MQQIPPVDSYEPCRVESVCELRQCLLLEVGLGADVDRHVVILGLDVVDRADQHDLHIGIVPNQDPLEGTRAVELTRDRMRWPTLATRYSLARLFQRLGQSFGVERLEQIIDGVNVERPDRIPIIGRHEDHGKLVANEFENLEAVELWHLDVEQDQIRPMLGSCPVSCRPLQLRGGYPAVAQVTSRSHAPGILPRPAVPAVPGVGLGRHGIGRRHVGLYDGRHSQLEPELGVQSLGPHACFGAELRAEPRAEQHESQTLSATSGIRRVVGVCRCDDEDGTVPARGERDGATIEHLSDTMHNGVLHHRLKQEGGARDRRAPPRRPRPQPAAGIRT